MKNILDLIGNTPLLDLGFLLKDKPKIALYAKAEWMNPGGSLKDRPVKRMLLNAVDSGHLKNGAAILDSSSGNAGIAYAMIGSALGRKVTIVIPGNASEERKQRIKSHGTELIETDPVEGYDEALRYVHELYEKNPGDYWLCDQYANDNNWQSHYYGTAEELIEQTDKPITHYVGGVGTGGSITGIGRRLKEKYKGITIVAIRPEEWPGVEGLKPLGSPENIIPEIFDESVVDEWIYVTADEAKDCCVLAAKSGLFIGQSSGAYLSGCFKLSNEIGSGVIATLMNDFGDRYFSSGLWR